MHDEPAMKWGRARPCCIALAAAVVLACASPPDFPPPVEVPLAFSDSGTGARPDRWWQELADPELSALVEEALAGSPDLAAVWDRLAQARALALREGAALLPAVDTDSGAATTWSDQPDLAGAASDGSRRDDDFRLGLAFSWEIDLFGRLRATRDAARRDAQASATEVRAAAVALSGRVADQWYGVVEQARQLAILDAQIRTNEEVLQLVTIRFRTGQSGAADVLRQRQLVEQRRGERAQVEALAEVAEHALAVLLGRPPVEVVLPPAETLPMPGKIPETGLPLELLERRPDVRRAYLDVLASDRRLVAARADRYPRVSLSASPRFTSEELADLLDNWVAAFGANLVAPLVDGGRRRAEVERTRAVVSERIHIYGQVILTSLQEVEDALVQERQQRILVESLETQLALAGQTLERLRDRYVKGGTNYLDVLDALSSQQALERNLVTGRRNLLGFRIDLHRALAGGFALEPPGPVAVTGETPAAAAASEGST